MAETVNKASTLTGLFKEVYAPSLRFLMPRNLRIQNDIKFVPVSRSPGNLYHQPVVLQHEHGFTYAVAGAGAFTVNTEAAGQIKDAQIVGAQIILQSVLDYESAAKATEGGPRAYLAATKYLVENMIQSFQKRVEVDLMYGQIGLGIISNVSTNDITISAETWAPGIWAGMEGASLLAWATGLATVRVGTMVIQSVNMDTRVISVDAAAASLAATDELFFFGQSPAQDAISHNTAAGIHKIMTNAGALFNISAADFSLWKSNTVAAGSVNLSFEMVQKLVAACVGKGATQDLTLYVNPTTWATLLSDQAALRRHGDPNKSTAYTLGSENITFWSQVGKITIKASIYVKQSFAYLLAPVRWHRVGATDITFRLPDRGDEFFFHLDDKAGYALRAYSNQAIFSEAPGQSGYMSGIDNT